MKPGPDDPNLTARQLGELEPGQEAAMDESIAGDPELQEEQRGIRDVHDLLKSTLEPGTEKLLPAQRENIRRAASQTNKITSFKEFREKSQPWLIPAAAVAVLGIGTVILIHMSEEMKPEVVIAQPFEKTTAQVALKPPAPPKPVAPPVPAIVHGSLKPTSTPSLELPIVSVRSDLAAISKSLRSESKLPPPASVHLEEILNNFPLRLHGTASISRSDSAGWHPDTREAGMTRHLATLTTELITCPWKPSANLLVISLRANARTDSTVKLTYHPNAATVLNYRLLGFNPAAGDGPATAAFPDRLPAGSYVNLALEIEPTAPGSELGSLEWSADGNSAPAVPLVHRRDNEPSDDARFAALVCLYAQWLGGEQPALIDADVVSAMAREINSSSLSPERQDFLSLINKSLNL